MNRPRLFGFERAWTDAAFDAFFPAKTALPHGVLEMQPAKYLDDTLQEVPLEPAIGVRLALWIVGLSPLFVLFKLRTFSGLAVEDRARVLSQLATHRVYAVRQLVIALKTMAALLYTQSTKVRAAMLAVTKEEHAELVSLRVQKRARTNEMEKIVEGKSHEHAA